ncbi:hypothetical protein HYH03_008516 [Edaphochlamys debaryana]|uniref:BTB domain-containing protein n=1 Tax=Edaphochlamys debaryana TaxID=47281 RepID=A0A835Y9B0_9CHLO|nr:hypothetical protein HYH03_008516 [Edaphochlamys debaryana]|eukprot:KAG2493384.1 hypothetical protein HYH03_008516 [Edaphochlamys debaryana]
MALSCRTLQPGCRAVGLVVRPRPGGGPDQALVFTEEGGIHELLGAGGDAGGGLSLGARLASASEASRVGHPVYDPVTQTVFFRASSTCISKLDASNRVSVVAGSGQHGRLDGVGAEALFQCIATLTADGCGGVWVADAARIRRLDTRSGEVTTLVGAETPNGPYSFWWRLDFDSTAAGTLRAAINTALCRVRTEGSDEDRVELVAGSWGYAGSCDGRSTAARFDLIRALLPVSGGRLLISDGPDLRCMDAGGAVTTLLRGCFGGLNARQMALLPSGDLGAILHDQTVAVVSGGDWAFTVPPSTAATDRLLSILAPPAAEEAGTSCSGGSRTAGHTFGSSSTAAACEGVTVRVGDRAFHAHRSVLAAGSEYFARLLAPGGGFEESGAPEVALPDADPAAFAHLLSYMYSTSLGLSGASSQLLAVPPELLRPTAALAGRLLMGGAVAALTERLAASTTTATVRSDLAWADAHGMTDLAERLRAFAVRKRKVVDHIALEEFGERCPPQAAKLLRASMQA